MFLHSLCGSYNISINYIQKRNQSFHPLKIVFSQLIFFFIQILQAATTVIQVTKAFHKNLLFQANSKHIFGRNSEIPQRSFLFSPKKRAFQLVHKINITIYKILHIEQKIPNLRCTHKRIPNWWKIKKLSRAQLFHLYSFRGNTFLQRISSMCHHSRNATFQPPYV